MSKETIGIGIIGCGTISDVYLNNIVNHYSNLKVVACSDMFVEKAQQTQKKYGIPKVYTVEELLEDEEVEIVVNLTIPRAHYEINMKALKAGKHVYCEKPLALTLEQADEILELAQEKGLLALSAPDTFLGAGAQMCRKLLDEGAIGEPIGFTANMTCAGHELWHPAPGFYYQKGAGPVMDMGPYYMTTLVMLLGPIKKVSCFAVKGRPFRKIGNGMQETEVMTHYAAVIEFVNGVVGTMNMSFDVWDSELPLMEIFGTDGALSIPDPNMFDGDIFAYEGRKLTELLEGVKESHPAKILTMIERKKEFRKPVENEFPVASAEDSNLRGLGISDMAQAILDNRPSRMTMELSRHVVEALNAFEISSTSGIPYVMTTTCERPQTMSKDAGLWEV